MASGESIDAEATLRLLRDGLATLRPITDFLEFEGCPFGGTDAASMFVDVEGDVWFGPHDPDRPGKPLTDIKVTSRFHGYEIPDLIQVLQEVHAKHHMGEAQCADDPSITTWVQFDAAIDKYNRHMPGYGTRTRRDELIGVGRRLGATRWLRAVEQETAVPAVTLPRVESTLLETGRHNLARPNLTTRQQELLLAVYKAARTVRRVAIVDDEFPLALGRLDMAISAAHNEGIKA